MSDKRALRWRCRRGMRELDVLLCGFLDHRYDQLPPEEKQVFERLLDLPDPELWRYVLGRESIADPAQAELIRRLRSSSA